MKEDIDNKGDSSYGLSAVSGIIVEEQKEIKSLVDPRETAAVPSFDFRYNYQGASLNDAEENPEITRPRFP